MKYCLLLIFSSILLCLFNRVNAAGHTISDTSKHKRIRHTLTFDDYKKHWKKHPVSYDDCIFNNKFSQNQRLSKYPFSKAVKIVAVSYQCCERNRDVLIDDTVARQPDSVFQSGLHVEGGKLNYSSLKEIKTLDQHQISRLTNIIYNTAYRKNVSRMPSLGPSCYNPRNALLFYNKNGKIYDYLEVCFECEKISSLSEKITIGTDCTQKLNLFKKFLDDAGIKYGTLKTD